MTVRGRRRDGDLERVVDEPEHATEHRAGHGLLEQDRAGLVHRDAQVLDLVQGEVQTGREAGRGRPQHRQVGTRSRQPDFHEVLGRGLACDLGHPHLQGGTSFSGPRVAPRVTRVWCSGDAIALSRFLFRDPNPLTSLTVKL